jgi:hypothetical protein
MKPEIIYYEFLDVSYLAVIKNGLVIDIACSKKDARMLSEESNVKLSEDEVILNRYITKIQSKDLALYTHWPVHTKEFWELLNET